MSSKAAHELFRFLAALSKSHRVPEYYPIVLPAVKTCLRQYMENAKEMTAEGAEDLYQAIGVVIACPSTTPATARQILEARLPCDNSSINRSTTNCTSEP